MFMGEFYHSIDAKGRIVIPSRFRDFFPTDKLVVTKGFEGCLNIYTIEQFSKIAEKLQALPSTKKDARDYMRIFLSKASECEIDGQNRINISSGLIRLANLTKQCVYIGVNDHVELWSTDNWEAYNDSIGDSFESIAESITDLMV